MGPLPATPLAARNGVRRTLSECVFNFRFDINMPTTDSPHILPIKTAADYLGLTERRLHQLIAEWDISQPSRAHVDFPWLMYAHCGLKITADQKRKPGDVGELVAIAWVVGVGGPAQATKEAHHLAALFVRNGRREQDAWIALGRALERLGED